MPGRRWTAKEELIVSLFYGSVPLATLAAQLGRSQCSIQTHAIRIRRSGEGTKTSRIKRSQQQLDEALNDNLRLSEDDLKEYL